MSPPLFNPNRQHVYIIMVCEEIDHIGEAEHRGNNGFMSKEVHALQVIIPLNLDI